MYKVLLETEDQVMSAYFTNNAANLGSLNITPFLSTPSLPNIIAEWAAVVPLVSHLASYRRDYHLVGELALQGRLSIGLFSKLGVLSGLSRLLKNGPAFLDQASTRGSSSQTVWDIKWGSIFPCANGAASSMIAHYALGKSPTAAIRMPEVIPQPRVNESPTSENDQSTPGSTRSEDTGDQPISEETEKSAPSPDPILSKPTVHVPMHFRRYQTLHVLQFSRSNPKMSLLRRLDLLTISPYYDAAVVVFLIGLAAVLCLLGVYGTSAIAVCSAVTTLSCRHAQIQRPPGYLENNEAQNDGCMLVATHQNVSTWYLYTGDRGIIDTILNKSMITIPATTTMQALAVILKATHVVQLLAMTFVAGQKGWDGVALVILVGIDWTLRQRYSSRQMTKNWLASEGISLEAKTFEFTGRTMLLGAVVNFSGTTRTDWVDNIIPPHPRRDAWLDRLAHREPNKSSPSQSMSWTPLDLGWIDLSYHLSIGAAEIMRKELRCPLPA